MCFTSHCALPLDQHEDLESLIFYQILQVEYTGSFLAFNRAFLLASTCPTRATPDFDPDSCSYKQVKLLILLILTYITSETRMYAESYFPFTKLDSLKAHRVVTFFINLVWAVLTSNNFITFSIPFRSHTFINLLSYLNFNTPSISYENY
jgi:hypothetical protein